MLACDFPQTNALLGKPNSMTDEQCYSLPVHKYKDTAGVPCILSCWRPNKEELQEIVRTGQIWVNTTGETLAPFSLHGENPFLETFAHMYHPVCGMSLEASVAGAGLMADEENAPVDFFFNGVSMRVYPGQKVPDEVYVHYYKAKQAADYFQNLIQQANGRPVPEL